MSGTPETPFARRVLAALFHKGLNQTDAAALLSKRIGKLVKPQAVQYMASKANSSRLSADLAEICEVNYEWLAHDKGEMAREYRANDPEQRVGEPLVHRWTLPVSENDLEKMARGENPDDEEDDIADALELVGTARGRLRKMPIVGAASLGYDGFWHELEFPVGHGDGYVEHYSTDRNAYALRVKGDSMFPAIRDGNIVVVEPNTQPNAGEFVMVRLKDGRSTVKELLWRKGGMIALQAVNGQQRLTLPEDQVDKVHFVGAIIPGSKAKNYTA